jgi:hypothetical protein
MHGLVAPVADISFIFAHYVVKDPVFRKDVVIVESDRSSADIACRFSISD